jgi:hypothetical protein
MEARKMNPPARRQIIAPHGGGGKRWSSLEERGDADGDAQLPERDGIRVRVSRGEAKGAQPD